MTKLLSYIVPVFNTAAYLSKCLDSLLQQNLSVDSYEILLTYDEGSIDNSLAICQDYAQHYSQIRLLSHTNRSMGASFNYALSFVQGKYVQLIDSDDFLEQGITRFMLDKMEKEQLDALRCNYQNVNVTYDVFYPYKIAAFDDYCDQITDGLTFLNERMGTACYIPTFIFRSDLVCQQGNEMTDLIINDTEWLPRIIIQTKRITSTERVGYNYFWRAESTMRTISPQRKRALLDDSICLLTELQKQAKQVADKRWYLRLISGIAVSVLTSVAQSFFAERKKYIRILKAKQVFPLTFDKISKRALWKIYLINISPTLFCWLMHIRLR